MVGATGKGSKPLLLGRVASRAKLTGSSTGSLCDANSFGPAMTGCGALEPILFRVAVLFELIGSSPPIPAPNPQNPSWSHGHASISPSSVPDDIGDSWKVRQDVQDGFCVPAVTLENDDAWISRVGKPRVLVVGKIMVVRYQDSASTLVPPSGSAALRSLIKYCQRLGAVEN